MEIIENRPIPENGSLGGDSTDETLYNISFLCLYYTIGIIALK